MNLLNRLRYLPVVILTVLAFTSCDDDINSIGGEIVGGQLEGLPLYEAGVVAYNKKLHPVQTNNLSSYLLGVYNDPVYGQQTANVLTQILLTSGSPTFGTEPTLDSVVLMLPYFSTGLERDSEGNREFRLDSVYGNSPFKLSISRSNYYLNDYDPEANFENRQKYYSDMDPAFKNNIIGSPLYENSNFQPSGSEVVYYEWKAPEEVDTIRASPRLRVNLPVQFFQENIINKEGSSELESNNNFKNFIRGLYFMAEPVNGDGTMMLLDFSHKDAGIYLYYTNTEEVNDEETVKHSTYKLAFGSNIVNTYNHEYPTPISQEISTSNSPPGAANLFLKGGEGSMAIVELFEDEAEIQELRDRKIIINEANLTFYVNQERVEEGESEPERLLLYDLDNNKLLLDYTLDPTLVNEDPNRAVITHSPPLVRDAGGNGIYYKIRLTQHVQDIISRGAENVKLGLVVTQNIQIVGNSAVKPSSGQTSGVDIRRVPSGSVNNPKGTVLHGNLSPDDDKRLKLNIFYTETNN